MPQNLGAYVSRRVQKYGLRTNDGLAAIYQQSPLIGNATRVKLAAPLAFSPDDQDISGHCLGALQA